MNLSAFLCTMVASSFSLLLLSWAGLGIKLLLDSIREDKRKEARRARRQKERDV